MKTKIFSHENHEYQLKFIATGRRENGAYHYSREIVENIIPRIETDRNWVTINVAGRCFDHSVVFIHNNDHPEWYDWLSHYKDLVLVCGVPSTVEKIKKHLPTHQVIYLPLSVDANYVCKFRAEKTKKQAFVGRLSKATDQLPKDCDIIGDISRDELLVEMAKYKKIYAVGRCALEAKVLGAEIGIYDPRYPQDIWTVLDNSEAAVALQEKLDIIDKKED